MSSSALLPVVVAITIVVAVAQIFVVRADRARRARGRRLLGGAGPWVLPAVLAIGIVAWVIATAVAGQ